MAGTDYEFPAAAIDAGRYVAVLQAELRAIAARLVMPEFMLTSDASNANYSSTMVAEGPAVQDVRPLAARHDRGRPRVALPRGGSCGGGGPSAGRRARRPVDIRAIAPTLAVRDRLRDAQADQILVRNGAMSPATMAMRHGLDPGQEREVTDLEGR